MEISFFSAKLGSLSLKSSPLFFVYLLFWGFLSSLLLENGRPQQSKCSALFGNQLLHLLGPILSALSIGERSVSLFVTLNDIFPVKSSCSGPQECPAQSTAPWKRTSPLNFKLRRELYEGERSLGAWLVSSPLQVGKRRNHQGTEISV